MMAAEFAACKLSSIIQREAKGYTKGTGRTRVSQADGQKTEEGEKKKTVEMKSWAEGNHGITPGELGQEGSRDREGEVRREMRGETCQKTHVQTDTKHHNSAKQKNKYSDMIKF